MLRKVLFYIQHIQNAFMNKACSNFPLLDYIAMQCKWQCKYTSC